MCNLSLLSARFASVLRTVADSHLSQNSFATSGEVGQVRESTGLLRLICLHWVFFSTPDRFLNPRISSLSSERSSPSMALSSSDEPSEDSGFDAKPTGHLLVSSCKTLTESKIIRVFAIVGRVKKCPNSVGHFHCCRC